MRLSRARRASLAAMGILVAAAVARPELANGLVARGDEVAAAGDSSRAIAYYRRALAIDPSSNEALDRTAIAALMQGDTASKEDASRRLRLALDARTSPSLLLDLALLQLARHHYAASAGTFRDLDAASPSVLFASGARVAARRAKGASK